MYIFSLFDFFILKESIEYTCSLLLFMSGANLNRKITIISPGIIAIGVKYMLSFSVTNIIRSEPIE